MKKINVYNSSPGKFEAFEDNGDEVIASVEYKYAVVVDAGETQTMAVTASKTDPMFQGILKMFEEGFGEENVTVVPIFGGGGEGDPLYL